MTLYRAVSLEEWEDLYAFGRFRRNSTGLMGRWFAIQEEHAVIWTEMNQTWENRPSLIVRADVPDDLIARSHQNQRQDGIGPAVYIEADDLHLVTFLP